MIEKFGKQVVVYLKEDQWIVLFVNSFSSLLLALSQGPLTYGSSRVDFEIGKSTFLIRVTNARDKICYPLLVQFHYVKDLKKLSLNKEVDLNILQFHDFSSVTV
jgi:hypothetical protein